MHVLREELQALPSENLVIRPYSGDLAQQGRFQNSLDPHRRSKPLKVPIPLRREASPAVPELFPEFLRENRSSFE